MRQPTLDNWRLKMQFGWGTLVIAALCGFIVTVAVAKHRVPSIHPPRSDAAPLCVSVSCAKLGDHVSYVLSGKVTQVSSPQPHVVCVQVASSSRGGDYCAIVP